MQLDRTEEQKFEVEKALEKRRERYYNKTMEVIGFMCHMHHKRGGVKRWRVK